MSFLNFKIDKIAIHEVFRRDDDRKKIDPAYSNSLESLDNDATEALRDRVVTAMSSAKRCIEMSIERTTQDSMMKRASDLVNADDQLFIDHSKRVADLLADAQQSRQLPGGIVVVFSGTSGVPEKRLIGVIKAEVHSGFTREKTPTSLKLKFLKNLLLTPQTKLYKIGVFIENEPLQSSENPGSWSAFIYDETISSSDPYGAAQYFYDRFLGCAFLESSARQTKQFHDLTKGFIKDMNIAEEEKVFLHNALVTYLKVDQTPTVGINDFATTYFGDPAVADAYDNYMKENDFPDTPVHKDLTDIASMLRLRSLIFKNQIKVTGPAAEFNELIKIDVIDSEDVNEEKWTQLTIKARIAKQE